MPEASYYTAESENGEVAADPSEDALFMRIADLKFPDNTNLVIEPAASEASWYVVVGLEEDSAGFEIEYANPAVGHHEVVQESDLGKLSRDLILWLGRAIRQSSGA